MAKADNTPDVTLELTPEEVAAQAQAEADAEAQAVAAAEQEAAAKQAQDEADAAAVAQAAADAKAASDAADAEAAKQPTPANTAGADIAAAITQGLRDAKEDKTIKITTDASVIPRFSVVKNTAGDVMLRENETGVLSRVQLESIEEKEASIQGQEVTEV